MTCRFILYLHKAADRTGQATTVHTSRMHFNVNPDILIGNLGESLDLGDDGSESGTEDEDLRPGRRVHGGDVELQGLQHPASNDGAESAFMDSRAAHVEEIVEVSMMSRSYVVDIVVLTKTANLVTQGSTQGRIMHFRSPVPPNCIYVYLITTLTVL